MAAIGAPGGLTQWEMRGVDYLRAVELLQEASDRPIVGLIIGQNGMSSTLERMASGRGDGAGSGRCGRRSARAILRGTWDRSVSPIVQSP